MALEQLRLHCGCHPVHEMQYDPASDASVTGAVVEAIATAAEVDPIDLPPLTESIDPDALERLFGNGNDGEETGKVLGFAVDGWNVFVSSDGRVRVCDSTDRTEASHHFDATTAARTD